MTNQKSGKTLNYKIVNLRALCIILVVLAHSIIIYNGNWNLYATTQSSIILKYLCNLIYIFHMPLFFSISGYLAYYSYKKVDSYKTFALKKAVRLLIPFIIFGLFWMIPIRFIANYSGYQDTNLATIIAKLLIGTDSGHLWFLPCLFLIFCVHLLLIRHVKNTKVQVAIIITLFLIGHFAPLMAGNVLVNLTWFHLGYLINKHRIDQSKKHAWVLLAASILGVIVYFVAESLFSNTYILRAIKYFDCFFIIMTAYKLVSRRQSKILNSISDLSFGIYLFHSPLIYLSFNYLPEINPYLMLLLNFAGFGSVAAGLTAIVKKTKIKMIIGE